jgi:hypothetical protein
MKYLKKFGEIFDTMGSWNLIILVYNKEIVKRRS